MIRPTAILLLCATALVAIAVAQAPAACPCAPSSVSTIATAVFSGRQCGATPAYYQLPMNPAPVFACEALSYTDGTLFSNSFNYTSNGYIYYVYFDTNCTTPAFSFYYAYDQCTYALSTNTSYMTLPSRTTAWVPQNPGNSTAMVDPSYFGATCDYANCTNPANGDVAQVVLGIFSDRQCNNLTTATGYFNLTLGQCYSAKDSDGSVTLKYTCNPFAITSYSTSDCTGPVLRAQGYSAGCLPVASDGSTVNVDNTYYTYHCPVNGAQTPPVDVTLLMSNGAHVIPIYAALWMVVTLTVGFIATEFLL